MTTPTTTETYVINVTDRNFATEVLERSKTTPVVVDFWAEWCGPCRMLGPVLEKLAAEYDGAFILAKMDVDHNPQVAMQFGIQGIPAVKAFSGGQMVNEFTGALPEPQVRKFIESLVPSEADQYVKLAYDWELSGQLDMAAENYRAVLADKPDHYLAMVGLGRILLKQGEREEALSLLEAIPAGARERPIADTLIAIAQFREYADSYSEPELRAKIVSNPDDVPARYALASLLATEERYPEAMEEFLEVVRRDRKYEDDGARKAMLALFNMIGEEDLLTRSYRQKLANVLF